jgi:hypothetical protein
MSTNPPRCSDMAVGSSVALGAKVAGGAWDFGVDGACAATGTARRMLNPSAVKQLANFIAQSLDPVQR